MDDIKLPKASSLKAGMAYAFTAMTKLKEENFDFTENSPYYHYCCWNYLRHSLFFVTKR